MVHTSQRERQYIYARTGCATQLTLIGYGTQTTLLDGTNEHTEDIAQSALLNSLQSFLLNSTQLRLLNSTQVVLVNSAQLMTPLVGRQRIIQGTEGIGKREILDATGCSQTG